MATTSPAKKKQGSKTAKKGFNNEKYIVARFNSFFGTKQDAFVESWLRRMLERKGLSLCDVTNGRCILVPVKVKSTFLQTHVEPSAALLTAEDVEFKKADLVIDVTLVSGCNITFKLSLKCTSKANYNQVDRRNLLIYTRWWKHLGFTDKHVQSLTTIFGTKETDKVRDRWDTLVSESDLQSLLSVFTNHSQVITSDIVKGRGYFSSDWVLVTLENENEPLQFQLHSCDEYMESLLEGFQKAELSKGGTTMKMGAYVLQRKGGTPDWWSMQFKIHPWMYNTRIYRN